MSARAIIVGKICTNIDRIGNEKKSGVNFSVACKDGKNVEFIKCTSWGKMSDIISKHLAKGDIIEVCGRLKVNEYINKENTKFRNTYVLVDSVDFISVSKKQANEQFDFWEEENNE